MEGVSLRFTRADPSAAASFASPMATGSPLGWLTAVNQPGATVASLTAVNPAGRWPAQSVTNPGPRPPPNHVSVFTPLPREPHGIDPFTRQDRA